MKILHILKVEYTSFAGTYASQDSRHTRTFMSFDKEKLIDKLEKEKLVRQPYGDCYYSYDFDILDLRELSKKDIIEVY